MRMISWLVYQNKLLTKEKLHIYRMHIHVDNMLYYLCGRNNSNIYLLSVYELLKVEKLYKYGQVLLSRKGYQTKYAMDQRKALETI